MRECYTADKFHRQYTCTCIYTSFRQLRFSSNECMYYSELDRYEIDREVKSDLNVNGARMPRTEIDLNKSEIDVNESSSSLSAAFIIKKNKYKSYDTVSLH